MKKILSKIKETMYLIRHARTTIRVLRCNRRYNKENYRIIQWTLFNDHGEKFVIPIKVEFDQIEKWIDELYPDTKKRATAKAFDILKTEYNTIFTECHSFTVKEIF